MKLRRWVYLAHRWLGIGMCLLLAMWFFSGMVMMYVGFPQLSTAERLAGLPALTPHTVQVGPQPLLLQLSPALGIEELRLTSVLGRPAWLLRGSDQSRHGMFADTGVAFDGFTAAHAQQAAVVYAAAAGIPATVMYRQQGVMDQWSVSSGLNGHRPLHLLVLNDIADTRLYISSVTGEVVRDTTAVERSWNWLGANLHWIYPWQLRQHATLWHWLIVVLSIAGLMSVITGALVGVWRLRLRRRYRGTDVTPYQGAMKFHHLLGLIFLLPLTTFMLSGLLSMNPWGVFSDDVSFAGQRALYRGTPTVADAIHPSANASVLRTLLHSHGDTREVVWQWLDGKMYAYAINGDGHRQLLIAPGQTPAGTEAELHAMIVTQVQKLLPEASVVAVERLDHYDSYYYAHHQRVRPLPVLRVQFDDAAASWFHIDLTTGELLNRLTTKARMQRWLYNGLHSLDFRWLLDHRPLWDVVMIALNLGGLLFSITAVVVAWRRLRPRRKRHPRTVHS